MKKLALLLCIAAVFASCNGSAKKELQAENDSLRIALNERNEELDDIMGTFNMIQDGFRQINEAEGRVDLQRGNVGENGVGTQIGRAHV